MGYFNLYAYLLLNHRNNKIKKSYYFYKLSLLYCLIVRFLT